MESYFSLSELRNTGKTLRSVNRFTLTVSLHPHLVNPLLSFSYSEGTIGGFSCDFLLRVLSERYVTLSQTVMPTNWTRRTPSPLESSVKHFFKFLFFSHFPISPSGEWVSVKCNNRTLIHILWSIFTVSVGKLGVTRNTISCQFQVSTVHHYFQSLLLTN